ncbi:MAG: zinc ribbon domain-containing protein [bacterium]|nr:zinc ribbon domain-containing protein [bacterium]
MPTYEYLCEHCGYKFEEFQKITEPPIRTCPKCKRNGKVQRLISPGAGFIFKGSGFYITDYRSEDYKKKASAEKTDASSSSKSADTSSVQKETSQKKSE